MLRHFFPGLPLVGLIFSATVAGATSSTAKLPAATTIPAATAATTAVSAAAELPAARPEA